MLCRGLEKNGMASVNQTRPHCVNQMGKTHSKLLEAWHGRGMAWARHAMNKSAYNLSTKTLSQEIANPQNVNAHMQ
jgi:hypothetical protein